MWEKYEAWVRGYVASHHGDVRNRCREAAHLMHQEFPELRLACGFAHWRYRDQHWWLIAPDGRAVDPTLLQFEGFVPEYEELDLGNPQDVALIPTGVCACCGAEVYEHAYFCSDGCRDEVVDGLNLRISEGPELVLDNHR